MPPPTWSVKAAIMILLLSLLSIVTPVPAAKGVGVRNIGGEVSGDDEGVTVVLVVGGRTATESPTSDVEVVLLQNGNGSSVTCDAPSEARFASRGYVGLVDTDGRPVVCGGNDVPDETLCYTYFYEDDSWNGGPSMIHERYYTAVARLLDGRQWLVGGGRDDTTLFSEYFDGETFTVGPLLPNQMYQACAVTLANGTVFLADDSFAYLFDVDTESFTRLPDIPYFSRYRTCGMAPSPLGGMDIVVLGTYSDPVYAYNTDSGQWRELDLTPYSGESTAVQLDDTFVTVGGWNDSDYLDEIYQYDGDDEEWILREEKLSQEKAFFAAIVVSPEVLNCQQGE